MSHPLVPARSVPWFVVLAMAGVATASAASGDDGLGLLRGSISPTVPAPVLALALPFGLPDLAVRTVLLALHLVGFALGLGGVTMLDVWIVRWMRGRPVSAETVRIFQYISKAIGVGLVLLWLSGLGMLGLFAASDPDALSNPKLWAKLAIVVTLTVNGLFIHRHALPVLIADVGGPLFADYPARRRSLLFAAGAVSGVSWYAAFGLGTIKEWNAKVPAETLLALWIVGVVAAWAVAEGAWRLQAWRSGLAATDPGSRAVRPPEVVADPGDPGARPRPRIAVAAVGARVAARRSA